MEKLANDRNKSEDETSPVIEDVWLYLVPIASVAPKRDPPAQAE
jgi:hypothetical protein